MGALTYQPEVAHDDEAKAINLDALSREATKVLSGKDSDVLSQLTSLGGSSGGARPKVLVGFRRRDRHLTHGVLDGDADHEPWLIKFHALEDPRDMGNIELAYHHMARAAGLRITDARLFEAKPKRRRASRAPQARQFFGTQRFDRSGDLGRVHTHSFGGLVHLDHRIPGGADYIDLLRTTRALTRDQREVEQMFRLMVFNVLAHNRDDHAKNFSFLMDVDGTWRVSPAYDLTFSAGPGGEHWLGVAGEGRRPTSAHLHEVAKRADVTPRSAARIVDEVRSAVAQWRAHAKKAGVSAASAKRIAFALEALGFAPADQRMKRATKGTHG